MTEIHISTRDGVCRSYVYTPRTGAGPWPGVLMYMDGIAIRPAMLQVAEQMAQQGFYVLLPDLFYRSGLYEPFDAKTLFSDPAKRQDLMDNYFAKATPEAIMSDTAAFLAYLSQQPEVKKGKIGTVGYCLGGRMVIYAAAAYPETIAAVASFHPGGMVTEAPNSPHTKVPQIKARVLVAGATDDRSFPDEAKVRFEQALTEAGIDHRLETWPAHHGWVFADTESYDAAQAERHYAVTKDLFNAVL